MTRGIGKRARLADVARPGGDQRSGDASLVNPHFVSAERSIADLRPRGSAALEGVAGARHDCGVVAPANLERSVLPGGRRFFDDLGRRSVVGEEQYQRVVRKLPEYFADVLIEPVDLRRIYRHSLDLPFFVRSFGPCWHDRVARRQRPLFADHAEIDLTPVAAGPRLVPTRAEDVPVLCDLRFEGVQRPVRRGEWNVQKEGIVRTLSLVLVEKTDRIFGDSICVEEPLQGRT